MTHNKNKRYLMPLIVLASARLTAYRGQTADVID